MASWLHDIAKRLISLEAETTPENRGPPGSGWRSFCPIPQPVKM
jgi:hypothetical protein